jgi:hypothetical protein
MVAATKPRDSWRDAPTKIIEVELDVLNDGPLRRAFRAFTYGGLWNGWAMPYFDKATADSIMGAFNDVFKRRENRGTVVRYRHEDDTYVFLDEDGEVEEYAGLKVKDFKLYPIGTCVWTWFQCDEV